MEVFEKKTVNTTQLSAHSHIADRSCRSGSSMAVLIPLSLHLAAPATTTLPATSAKAA